MKKLVIGLSVGVLVTAGLAGTGAALGDDDKWYGGRRGPDVAPVKNTLYAGECGSCHMAYQPGLLPARSWKKLMDNLADHFGDNAELPAAQRKVLLSYLVDNAADKVSERRARRIAATTPRSQTPIRISETRYIKAKHREIPMRMIEGNPKVRSRANCIACHTRADQGSYREHEIRIPGFGRWDD